MALLTSPRQLITILLPEQEIGGTHFKQVGYVIHQGWDQPLATGEVNGVIVVQVKRFAIDESKPDGIGVELAEFNPKQPVRLIGDNNTLLAQDDGEVVAQRVAETAAEWQALVAAKAAELHPRNVVLQGDALEFMRENPVAVGAEIRRHLAAAPAYHFAPKDAQNKPILAVAP